MRLSGIDDPQVHDLLQIDPEFLEGAGVDHSFWLRATLIACPWVVIGRAEAPRPRSRLEFEIVVKPTHAVFVPATEKNGPLIPWHTADPKGVAESFPNSRSPAHHMLGFCSEQKEKLPRE